MKKILLFLSFLLMSIGVLGATSTLIFLRACGGSGTADDGTVWTVNSDAAESVFDNTRGIHYGTSSASVSYLEITTAQINGTITRIKVNASGASGTSAKLDITVNGNSFGSQQSLTSTATEYTFIGSANGTIIVRLSQSSAKKALYCKSIEITYTPNTTYTVSFFNMLGDAPNSIKQGAQGGSITLPTDIEICNKCYKIDWVFDGWVESLDNYNNVYTTSYTPRKDTLLYVLFSRGLENVYIDEYRRVTENQDNWDGDYLIANHSSIFADGSVADDKILSIDPSSDLVSDIVNIKWGDLHKLTITEISEGSNTYVIQTGDDSYIYAYSGSNNIQHSNNFSTASSHPITITFNNSSNISIVSESRYLQYNSSAQMFRFYTGGQQPIYMYKRVKTLYPHATEYSTTPECDSSFITTWNKDKIFIDKGLSYNLDGKTVTIKDIDTDETLSNSITYDSSTDLYQVNTNLTGKECDKINIFITDNNTDSIYLIYKVPFIVDADAYTTSMDDENCDVVVLPGKKLTVSGTESEHRDVKLYAGAHLSVPSGTEYTVNSLSLRRDNLTTSTLGLSGTISANKLYFDLYVDASDWYFVCLPNTFNLSTLKYINGRIPQYKKNFWVRWYDGEGRAYTQSASWRNVDHDKTFTKGEGFIFALNDVLKKKEFRFELPVSTFTVDGRVDNLHAWGGDVPELRPNHKGWNLIGHPFMNSIKTDLAEPIMAGQLVPTDTDPWDGKWQVDSTETRGMKRLRYAVIPSKDEEDAPAGYYKSVVLDDYILLPFTSFFIQMGGTDPSTNQCLTFNTTSSGPFSAPRRSLKYDENEELFLRVKVGDRKTGCFISNKFTDEYEPGDDLESRYPIYQSIGGYKLLYSAINDSIIEHGVQVISPQGTLCLDPKVDISKFEYIYVNHNGNWYNLKVGETVNIESGSFILQAKRKSNNVATGLDAIPTNGVYKFSDGNNIYINRNNIIFNIIGSKVK